MAYVSALTLPYSGWRIQYHIIQNLKLEKSENAASFHKKADKTESI